MKKQPWLLALMAALGVVLVSLTAWSLVRSRPFDALPIRNDIIAAFYCDQEPCADQPAADDGTAMIVVTREGVPERKVVGIVGGYVSMSVQDKDCDSSDGQVCRYHLNAMELQLGDVTDIHGVTLKDFEIRLPRPARDLVAKGGRIDLPDDLELLVSTYVDGKFQESRTVTPGDGFHGLGFMIDVSTQELVLTGNLSGTGPDLVGKTVELEVTVSDAAVTPFFNIAPTASAKPKTYQADCYAKVELEGTSTDADGNLRDEFFFRGSRRLGSKTLREFPGEHLYRVLARDVLGGQDMGSVNISIEDTGSSEVPEGGEVVEFETPSGVVVEDVALLAGDRLKVSDRVKVRGLEELPTQVVNLGTADGSLKTLLHADTVVTGNVWSQPKTWLMERATVTGNLYTTSEPDRQNQTSVGELVQPYSFEERTKFSFPVPGRLEPLNDVGFIEPDQFKQLDEGEYGWVHVKSRARLKLGEGFYRFSDIKMEPDSVLELTDDTPTMVVVDDGVTLRGRVEAPEGGGLVVVHLGMSEVIVNSPFQGAMLSPHSKLTLTSSNQTEHRGSFFARDIQVDSDAVIVHDPSYFAGIGVVRNACALTPEVRCVDSTPSGPVAHFSHINAVDYTGVLVRHGFSNRMSPGLSDQGQPDAFNAGHLPAEEFSIPFETGGSISWTLGGQTATATENSPACQ